MDSTSKDVSTDFHLEGLPDIPLLRILRYADAISLENLCLTNRWINQFITQYRKRLVCRRIYWMKIIQQKNADHENKESIYDIRVHKSDEHQETSRRSYSVNDSTSSTPLFVWLAHTFSNCRIGKVQLLISNLGELEVDVCERAMVESKLRIETIDMVNARVEVEADSLFRIVRAVNPEFITSFFTEQFIRNLSREAFDSRMSELRFIQIIHFFEHITFTFMRLPDHIPKKFSTSKAIIEPMESVLKTVQDWWRSGEESSCWWTVIRKTCDKSVMTVKDLSYLLEIPNEIVRHDGRDKLLLENLGGHKLYMYPLGEPHQLFSGAIVWSIEGGVYVEV